MLDEHNAYVHILICTYYIHVLQICYTSALHIAASKMGTLPPIMTGGFSNWGSIGRPDPRNKGNRELVKLILNAPGTDRNLKDNQGRTALDIAVSLGHIDVLEALRGEKAAWWRWGCLA